MKNPPCAPTKYALATIAIAILATVVELWLAAMTTTTGLGEGPNVLLLAFLAGPLIFLALVAWRRRTHDARSRLCLAVVIVAAIAGIALLTNDFIRLRSGLPKDRVIYGNPVLLPLGQWLLVVALWVMLVVVESREKRASNLPNKKA